MRQYIIAAAVMLLCFTGCKQNDLMEYEGQAYIYFGPAKEYANLYMADYDKRYYQDTSKSYTFFYDDESVTQVEIPYNIYITGGPRDYDRPFVLEQILDEGVANAVPGVNYKAFDSPEMKDVYTFKAGEVHLTIPIVILRDQTVENYVLRFQVADNEHFVQGEKKYLWSKTLFTSALQRPDAWTTSMEDYLGKYSRVKHEWFIEETGLLWDNESTKTLMNQMDAFMYWCAYFKTRLVEINSQRADEDLDEWKDEDGVVIAMGKYA